MARRIAMILGHPDPRGNRFCNALADAYTQGAEAAGHPVRRVDVARLDFPLLRTREDWEKGEAPEPIRQAQEIIKSADHLAIVYPLWGGDMPALLKAFFEQALRPGFAFSAEPDRPARKLLEGKTARIVVTMGMPALFYRCYYRAHSLKSLKRNILGFCGIGPVRTTLIGMVEANEARRKKWIEKMRALGRDGR